MNKIVQVIFSSEEIASIDELGNFIDELSKHLMITGTSIYITWFRSMVEASWKKQFIVNF